MTSSENSQKSRQIRWRVLFFACAALGLVADRASKRAIEAVLAPGQSMPFLPGILDFQLVYNTGAAWGMLDGALAFFLVIALGVTAAAVVYLFRYEHHRSYEVVALSLVVAGALGNLYDRLVYGRVTDFLHTLFVDFPVFNVADSCITVGIVLLAIFFIFSKNSPFAEDGKKDGADLEKTVTP